MPLSKQIATRFRSLSSATRSARPDRFAVRSMAFLFCSRTTLLRMTVCKRPLAPSPSCLARCRGMRLSCGSCAPPVRSSWEKPISRNGPIFAASLPSDYTSFLHRGALKGARIGVDRRYFTAAFGGESDLVAVAKQGLEVMKSLGATLINTDTGDPSANNFKFYNDELIVLLFEFKV